MRLRMLNEKLDGFFEVAPWVAWFVSLIILLIAPWVAPESAHIETAGALVLNAVTIIFGLIGTSIARDF